MKSLQLFDAQEIKITEANIPEINDDEILLKTKAAAVCGTDIRMWQNGHKNASPTSPLTLGHEFSGEIAKVGSKVSFYKKGMRIAIQPNFGCGICDRCVAGNFHLCDTYRAFGINIDGAFADYVVIPPEAIERGNLMIIPENVSFVEAAIAEPLSCAYNGFSKLSVKPGEVALVVGAGPIGVMHAKLLLMAGASVMMNDLSEERLAFCKNIMPKIKIHHGENLASFIMKETQDKGLDISITACPVPSVQREILEYMGYGGRVSYFAGIPAHKQPVSIDTNIIHYKELFITGSTRSSIAQFRKVLDFIAKDLLSVKEIITHTYRLDEAIEAFENSKKAIGIKHVVCFD